MLRVSVWMHTTLFDVLRLLRTSDPSRMVLKGAQTLCPIRGFCGNVQSPLVPTVPDILAWVLEKKSGRLCPPLTVLRYSNY